MFILKEFKSKASKVTAHNTINTTGAITLNTKLKAGAVSSYITTFNCI